MDNDSYLEEVLKGYGSRLLEVIRPRLDVSRCRYLTYEPAQDFRYSPGVPGRTEWFAEFAKRRLLLFMDWVDESSTIVYGQAYRLSEPTDSFKDFDRFCGYNFVWAVPMAMLLTEDWGSSVKAPTDQSVAGVFLQMYDNDGYVFLPLSAT